MRFRRHTPRPSSTTTAGAAAADASSQPSTDNLGGGSAGGGGSPSSGSSSQSPEVVVVAASNPKHVEVIGLGGGGGGGREGSKEGGGGAGSGSIMMEDSSLLDQVMQQHEEREQDGEDDEDEPRTQPPPPTLVEEDISNIVLADVSSWEKQDDSIITAAQAEQQTTMTNVSPDASHRSSSRQQQCASPTTSTAFQSVGSSITDFTATSTAGDQSKKKAGRKFLGRLFRKGNKPPKNSSPSGLPAMTTATTAAPPPNSRSPLTTVSTMTVSPAPPSTPPTVVETTTTGARPDEVRQPGASSTGSHRSTPTTTSPAAMAAMATTTTSGRSSSEQVEISDEMAEIVAGVEKQLAATKQQQEQQKQQQQQVKQQRPQQQQQEPPPPPPKATSSAFERPNPVAKSATADEDDINSLRSSFFTGSFLTNEEGVFSMLSQENLVTKSIDEKMEFDPQELAAEAPRSAAEPQESIAITGLATAPSPAPSPAPSLSEEEEEEEDRENHLLPHDETNNADEQIEMTEAATEEGGVGGIRLSVATPKNKVGMLFEGDQQRLAVMMSSSSTAEQQQQQPSPTVQQEEEEEEEERVGNHNNNNVEVVIPPASPTDSNGGGGTNAQRQVEERLVVVGVAKDKNNKNNKKQKSTMTQPPEAAVTPTTSRSVASSNKSSSSTASKTSSSGDLENTRAMRQRRWLFKQRATMTKTPPPPPPPPPPPRPPPPQQQPEVLPAGPRQAEEEVQSRVQMSVSVGTSVANTEDTSVNNQVPSAVLDILNRYMTQEAYATETSSASEPYDMDALSSSRATSSLPEHSSSTIGSTIASSSMAANSSSLAASSTLASSSLAANSSLRASTMASSSLAADSSLVADSSMASSSMAAETFQTDKTQSIKETISGGEASTEQPSSSVEASSSMLSFLTATQGSGSVKETIAGAPPVPTQPTAGDSSAKDTRISRRSRSRSRSTSRSRKSLKVKASGSVSSGKANVSHASSGRTPPTPRQTTSGGSDDRQAVPKAASQEKEQEVAAAAEGDNASQQVPKNDSNDAATGGDTVAAVATPRLAAATAKNRSGSRSSSRSRRSAKSQQKQQQQEEHGKAGVVANNKETKVNVTQESSIDDRPDLLTHGKVATASLESTSLLENAVMSDVETNGDKIMRQGSQQAAQPTLSGDGDPPAPAQQESTTRVVQTDEDRAPKSFEPAVASGKPPKVPVASAHTEGNATQSPADHGSATKSHGSSPKEANNSEKGNGSHRSSKGEAELIQQQQRCEDDDSSEEHPDAFDLIVNQASGKSDTEISAMTSSTLRSSRKDASDHHGKGSLSQTTLETDGTDAVNDGTGVKGTSGASVHSSGASSRKKALLAGIRKKRRSSPVPNTGDETATNSGQEEAKEVTSDDGASAQADGTDEAKLPVSPANILKSESLLETTMREIVSAAAQQKSTMREFVSTAVDKVNKITSEVIPQIIDGIGKPEEWLKTAEQPDKLCASMKAEDYSDLSGPGPTKAKTAPCVAPIEEESGEPLLSENTEKEEAGEATEKEKGSDVERAEPSEAEKLPVVAKEPVEAQRTGRAEKDKREKPETDPESADVTESSRPSGPEPAAAQPPARKPKGRMAAILSAIRKGRRGLTKKGTPRKDGSHQVEHVEKTGTPANSASGKCSEPERHAEGSVDKCATQNDSSQGSTKTDASRKAGQAAEPLGNHETVVPTSAERVEKPVITDEKKSETQTATSSAQTSNSVRVTPEERTPRNDDDTLEENGASAIVQTLAHPVTQAHPVEKTPDKSSNRPEPEPLTDNGPIDKAEPETQKEVQELSEKKHVESNEENLPSVEPDACLDRAPAAKADEETKTDGSVLEDKSENADVSIPRDENTDGNASDVGVHEKAGPEQCFENDVSETATQTTTAQDTSVDGARVGLELPADSAAPHENGQSATSFKEKKKRIGSLLFSSLKKKVGQRPSKPKHHSESRAQKPIIKNKDKTETPVLDTASAHPNKATGKNKNKDKESNDKESNDKDKDSSSADVIRSTNESTEPQVKEANKSKDRTEPESHEASKPPIRSDQESIKAGGEEADEQNDPLDDEHGPVAGDQAADILKKAASADEEIQVESRPPKPILKSRSKVNKEAADAGVAVLKAKVSTLPISTGEEGAEREMANPSKVTGVQGGKEVFPKAASSTEAESAATGRSEKEDSDPILLQKVGPSMSLPSIDENNSTHPPGAPKVEVTMGHFFVPKAASSGSDDEYFSESDFQQPPKVQEERKDTGAKLDFAERRKRAASPAMVVSKVKKGTIGLLKPAMPGQSESDVSFAESEYQLSPVSKEMSARKLDFAERRKRAASPAPTKASTSASSNASASVGNGKLVEDRAPSHAIPSVDKVEKSEASPGEEINKPEAKLEVIGVSEQPASPATSEQRNALFAIKATHKRAATPTPSTESSSAAPSESSASVKESLVCYGSSGSSLLANYSNSKKAKDPNVESLMSTTTGSSMGDAVVNLVQVTSASQEGFELEAPEAIMEPKKPEPDLVKRRPRRLLRKVRRDSGQGTDEDESHSSVPSSVLVKSDESSLDDNDVDDGEVGRSRSRRSRSPQKKVSPSFRPLESEGDIPAVCSGGQRSVHFSERNKVEEEHDNWEETSDSSQSYDGYDDLSDDCVLLSLESITYGVNEVQSILSNTFTGADDRRHIKDRHHNK